MSRMWAVNGYGWNTHKSNLNDTKNNPSTMQRLASVKPSMLSSRSRDTLIGDDSDSEIKSDMAHGRIGNVYGYSWSERLLAVFCIHGRGRYISIPTAGPMDLQGHQTHQNSPWILPVYVLSTERDDSRHFIPKEAKCTIDSGNLQGNIVSKAFLTDVLGYPESSFQPLTKLEEVGGTGVTGHKLIPQGAVYLTWYHNNSTRVFRDMRFLISEHPMHDLVIGSQSIHENGILDVPNLGDLIVWDRVKAEEERNRLREEWNELNDKFQDSETGVGYKVEMGCKDDNVMKEYEIQQKNIAAAHERFIQEDRRFQIERYRDEFKKSGGHKTTALEEYLKEWVTAYPNEKQIPAADLTSHSNGATGSKG